MKLLHTLVLASVTMAGVACNSSSSSSPVSRPAAIENPPVAEESIDCGTLSFAKSTQLDALPGGVWSGRLVDCANNVTYDRITALVTEDGRFRILGENGHALRGSLTTDGDTFDGTGLDFAAAGNAYFSGPTTDLFVAGNIDEHNVLEGRWGTEWGNAGYFSLTYDYWIYEHAFSLQWLAGAWSAWTPTEQGRTHWANGVWTIEPDGRFNGQDDSSCLYQGYFSPIDERYNLFDVTLDVAGCAYVGSYTGLASADDFPDWWENALDIHVDNGTSPLSIRLLLGY